MENTRFTSFFFFNDTATTEIYTLSLHDALPISEVIAAPRPAMGVPAAQGNGPSVQSVETNCPMLMLSARSEEHTSELQSRSDLVCRLLLEKKKVAALADPAIADTPRVPRSESSG